MSGICAPKHLFHKKIDWREEQKTKYTNLIYVNEIPQMTHSICKWKTANDLLRFRVVSVYYEVSWRCSLLLLDNHLDMKSKQRTQKFMCTFDCNRNIKWRTCKWIKNIILCQMSHHLNIYQWTGATNLWWWFLCVCQWWKFQEESNDIAIIHETVNSICRSKINVKCTRTHFRWATANGCDWENEKQRSWNRLEIPDSC